MASDHVNSFESSPNRRIASSLVLFLERFGRLERIAALERLGTGRSI
jgi:hypothetical protein